MSNALHEFLRTRYSAYPIMLGTSRVKPGALLETRWRWGWPWDTNPEFIFEDPYSWDVLGEAASAYSSSIVEANLIQASIDESVTLGGSASLPQYGLSFAAALASKYKGTIKVTGLHAKVFDNSMAPYWLMQKLLGLRNKDTGLWNLVNDDFLVAESYHVSSLTAEFKQGFDGSIKGALEKSGYKIEAGLEIKWLSDSSFELVGTSAVPIAVRGLKV